MTRSYYIKRGRRYVPAGIDLGYPLPIGAHLVVVDKNCTSTICGIEPDYASTLAAAKVCRDAMVGAMHEKSRLEPRQRVLTPKQRAAADAFREALGDDAVMVRASIMDIVDAGIAALVAAVNAIAGESK